MIGKQNSQENFGSLGEKWILAPSGKEVIDRCQSEALDLRYDVCALGPFYRNLASHDFADEEIYGVELVFEKLSKRLGAIFDELRRSTMRAGNNHNEE